jgi:hypothetical protein
MHGSRQKWAHGAAVELFKQPAQDLFVHAGMVLAINDTFTRH